MNEETKHKTAFVIPHGLFKWTVMPFRLGNSLVSFEQLIGVVLRRLHWKTCLIYLDDVIVVSFSFKENLDRLEVVFLRPATTGLKLKPRKCKLFQKRVAYWGHIVTPSSEEGVTTDPAKIELVQKRPTPESTTNLQIFLALASYCR